MSMPTHPPVESTESSQHPIFRLPPELLSHVFGISLQSTKIYFYHRNLMSLRLVCKEWNHLIEQSPALWSVIDTALTLDTMERILAKSCAHPLTIWALEDNIRYRGDAEIVLRTCLKELRRSVTLTLKVPSKYFKRPLVDLFAQPFPLLRSLSLSLFHDEERAATVDLFGTHTAARLQDIDLEGIDVQWNWPMLPSLRTLKLTLMDVTIAELTNILASSPTLQLLTLGRIHSGRSVAPLPRLTPIKLPSLIKLKVTDNDEEIVRQLLESIVAPVCVQVFIATPFRDPVSDVPEPNMPLLSDFLLSNFANVFPTIFPIRGRIIHICSWFSVQCAIEFEGDNDGATYRQGNTSFSVHIHEAQNAWPFALEFHRRYTQGQPCSVQDYGSTILPHIEILFQLDVTTTFTLHCNRDGDELNALFDYFARPHSFPSLASSKWLFPKLEDLTLDYPETMDGVVAMVKRRYNAEVCDSSPASPVRLKRLRISGTKGAVNNMGPGIAELKNILGDDVVYCY